MIIVRRACDEESESAAMVSRWLSTDRCMQVDWYMMMCLPMTDATLFRRCKKVRIPLVRAYFRHL